MDCTIPISLLSERSSGILLPLFSLPGPWGIGDMGASSFRFIDFLKKSGQRFWQMLPLGPVSPVFGNSPYMSPSAFAGNPLYIDLETLTKEDLLDRRDLPEPVFSEYLVDYPLVNTLKVPLLRKAWQRFQQRAGWREELRAFLADHPWAEDHGLFLALKAACREQPWYAWPEPLRDRQPEAIQAAAGKLREEIGYFVFEQYLFFRQWRTAREYARAQDVYFIGDLPIYVALDSVDVWTHQRIFQMEAGTARPSHVAGVPPDYFSKTGQLWGNPLYCWGTKDTCVQQELMDWWEQRFLLNFLLSDVLRLDHFRGFESYWAVPAEAGTAEAGAWRPGPGKSFFKEMERRLGGMPLIAEDLGIITPEVETLRRELGYPGMKILLFAFDGTADNSYLPYNMEQDSVVYTGTHDNDTAVGWYLSPEIPWDHKERAKRFANREDTDAASFHSDMAYLALSSRARLAILPLQDAIGLGNDCRVNVPGTVGDNWRWRCTPNFINDHLAGWLYELNRRFGRLPADKAPACPGKEH